MQHLTRCQRALVTASRVRVAGPSAVARRAPAAAAAIQVRLFSDAKGDGASADAAASSSSSSGAQASASAGAAASPELEKISQLEKEVKDLKDRVVRSLAEEENVRRIAKRDVDNARAYAVTGFAKSLLDVADDFERALAAVPAADAPGAGCNFAPFSLPPPCVTPVLQPSYPDPHPQPIRRPRFPRW